MRLNYFLVDFLPDSLMVLAAWDFSCFDDLGSRISLDACDLDIFFSIVLMFSRYNSINDLHQKLFADFVSIELLFDIVVRYFSGIRNGTQTRANFCDVYHFKDDKIVEMTSYIIEHGG